MKIKRFSNHHIVVEPEPWEVRNHNHSDLCKNLGKTITEIKRHVDTGQVYLEFTTEEVCSFCGTIWEKEWDKGLPYCCGDAQNEWIVTNCKITQDGNQICVLLGENLQTGIAGFGKDNIESYANFITEYIKQTEGKQNG